MLVFVAFSCMYKSVEVVISPVSFHLESKTNMYSFMCIVVFLPAVAASILGDKSL